MAQFIARIIPGLAPFLPISIVANSMATTRTRCWRLGWIGMLSLYAAVVLGAGGWLLTRRDA